MKNLKSFGDRRVNIMKSWRTAVLLLFCMMELQQGVHGDEVTEAATTTIEPRKFSEFSVKNPTFCCVQCKKSIELSI